MSPSYSLWDDQLPPLEENDDPHVIQNNEQPLFDKHDRDDMAEEFRRSPVFDWLIGRLTPIQEEDQFELDELEADQWIADHPDMDPWQPIGLSLPVRSCSTPFPPPNVHLENPHDTDASLTQSEQKTPRRFFKSTKKILARTRIGKSLISCCCPCGKY
jgi:hypothetical protein